MFLNVVNDFFTSIDSLIAGFMSGIFNAITTFWNEMINRAGNGAYICFILVGVFFLVIFLIGLVNFMKKFGWFLVFLLIFIGIPVLWYFVAVL